MFFALCRLFLRLFFLIFLVWSIFYFYVFGYRYNIKENVDFRTAGIYQVKVFSNVPFIKLNWKKIFLVDHQVNLYSLYEWECWELTIKDFHKFICFDGKNFNKIIYIDPQSLQIKPFRWKYFLKLDLACKENTCKFKFDEIDFFVDKNWNIFYSDDTDIYKLTQIKNFKPLGYTQTSLIWIKNWHLIEIKIKPKN